MTPGSRSRRIAVTTAVWTIAALSGGCHGVPIGRVAAPAPVPNRPSTTLGSGVRTALFGATAALDIPSEMASIDPSNSAGGDVTRTSAVAEGMSRSTLISTEFPAPAEPLPPTPLLDAALVRARAQGDVVDHAEATAPLPTLASANEVGSPSVPVSPATPEAVVDPPVPIATPTSRPAEVAPAALVVAPEELWRDGVRKLVGLARSKQEQEQGGTGRGEPWGLRTRVLAWLAEPDIDPDLGGHDTDGVHAVLRALEVPAPGEGRVNATDPQVHGDDLRIAIRTLQAKAPLELVDLQVCAEVRRFGDFVPFETPERRAGDWIVIYCEVDGLHNEPTSSGFQTRLAGRMEIIPASGGLALALPLGTAEETFLRRRRDYHVAYKKELPQNLAPGAYTLRIILRDVFADRSATREVGFMIGRDRKPAGTPLSPLELLPNP